MKSGNPPVGWTSELADTWRWYTPPSRPSSFDLRTCSKYLTNWRREFPGRRPHILILGSTSEFRDWAFREGAMATIVDKSRQYYERASDQVVHRNPLESVKFLAWEELDDVECYDFAVGDLVIGNIQPGYVPSFLARLRTALRERGYFLTKSFFRLIDTDPCGPEQFVELLADPRVGDPFTALAYDLTLTIADPETGVVEFADMYRLVENLVASGHLPGFALERLSQLGWSSSMKISFLVYDERDWLKMASEQFTLVERAIPPEGGPLAKFPMYVFQKQEQSAQF